MTPPTLGIRVDDDLFPPLLEARLADDLFRPTDGDRQHLRRWPPCRAGIVFGLLRSGWMG